MAVAIVFGGDALKNSCVGAVEQRPPSGDDLARRSEARVVQETAIELSDEEVVEVVIDPMLCCRPGHGRGCCSHWRCCRQRALVTTLRSYHRAAPLRRRCRTYMSDRVWTAF